ncbi:MAG: MurR/RpiR family transcriptional regulator [Pseudomonadota bacterium]|uniref:MurR/RpiR family transcriptional regulator n=1 Tax=Gallaecimonas pentaromativorans TaxID=584787 RepID=UPI00067EF8F1|nr:MurR/RpiR family transcriptional regulator [Gallaecimonas pentaromativorans]MED5525638.1 MurR/RpiR family transcriptional regulator [Pseudomonadota bacterium]
MPGPQTLHLADYRERLASLQHLPEAELKVAHYIEGIFKELPFYGITDIANTCGVSKATIGRFLNKIGFLGYARFKAAVVSSLEQGRSPSPWEAANRGLMSDDQAVFACHVKDVVANLYDSLDQISASDFDQAASYLADLSKKLYVIGPASSGSLAVYFTTFIRYIRGDVQQLSLDTSLLPHSLLDVDEHSVLFVISFYRFNVDAAKVTKWFRARGAKIVVLSNTSANPYSPHSDIELIVASKSGSIFQSRSSGLVLIEALLRKIALDHMDKSRMDALESLFGEFNTFP